MARVRRDDKQSVDGANWLPKLPIVLRHDPQLGHEVLMHGKGSLEGRLVQTWVHLSEDDLKRLECSPAVKQAAIDVEKTARRTKTRNVGRLHLSGEDSEASARILFEVAKQAIANARTSLDLAESAFVRAFEAEQTIADVAETMRQLERRRRK